MTQLDVLQDLNAYDTPSDSQIRVEWSAADLNIVGNSYCSHLVGIFLGCFLSPVKKNFINLVFS